MKKNIILALAVAVALPVAAKKKDKKNEGYVFTTVVENPITSVKNQNRSGTCWSFSGQAFLESELLRTGKPEIDLSDMFVVYHSYNDKADKYVRTHGNLNFAAGGSFYDVLYVLNNYGAVPEEAYEGLEYGEPKHVHTELDNTTKAYVTSVANTSGKLTTAWKKGFEGILDAYLGELPETFVYEGKEYTPESFAKYLGLNADDYVSITSYTHHPFYSQFAIEIPDNWRWATSYNVPMEEMKAIADNALNNGYTIAWGGDVSEKGFTRDGLAVLLDVEGTELTGSDQARWLGLTSAEKDEEIKKMMESPSREQHVTQESRQDGYDRFETTDDHGMQMYGIAEDQNGNKYYMIKNSWGETGKYDGHWYMSEPFFNAKTMNYIVHKDAIPTEIAKKMGLK